MKNLFPNIGGAYLTDVLSESFPHYIIEVRQMSWGEWRASAIELGTLSPSRDGHYCNTVEEAINDLRILLESK